MSGPSQIQIEVRGVRYPVTFGGRAALQIDQGCYAISDPVRVELAAGEIFHSRGV